MRSAHNACQASTVARGSTGMLPQETLDIFRSILVHFGTLVHHGKVPVRVQFVNVAANR